ncbi:hypothetical protein GCM10010273_14340 [Streptomyces lavendulocolor]
MPRRTAAADSSAPVGVRCGDRARTPWSFMVDDPATVTAGRSTRFPAGNRAPVVADLPPPFVKVQVKAVFRVSEVAQYCGNTMERPASVWSGHARRTHP